MGTVYRKTFTKPLPPGAIVKTKRRKPTKAERTANPDVTEIVERFATWQTRKGKTKTAPVTTGRDGTERIVVKSGTYIAKYRDGEGIVREVSTGCRDITAARAKLAELKRRAELVRGNVMTASEDRISRHQDTPLRQHADDYVKHLEAKSVHPARVKNTQSRLRRVAADCGFMRLRDVNASRFERWLLDRQTEGMSAGARNGYREAWIGFMNWCMKTGRLLDNPLATVPKADAKADCRRKRRALTEDELRRLLDAARRRPLHDAMTIRTGPNKGKAIAQVSEERRDELERVGRERALIYKTYLLTGLRKSELASLTVGNLELDGKTPYAVLDASADKSRRGADIPLRSDLAAEIREWLDEKLHALRKEALANGQPVPAQLPPETPVFSVPDGLRRILDRDLAFAGIPKKDDRGRTIDIHALRHTFGTHLSKAGVAPRVAQAAMRHSSIDLTMNVYTDPRLLDVQSALEALPDMPIDDSPTSEREKATGTDGRKLAPTLAPNDHNLVQAESIQDNWAELAESGQDTKKPRNSKENRGFVESGRLDLNQRPLRPERSALPG
ncbi:MAG: integrase [Pirellulaceae bacterium]|nr:MAG: integrase [Pirellulaceae bacterium]